MDNLIALVPSIGVGILFALVIRYFLRADRIEREAMAELDSRRPGHPASPVASDAPNIGHTGGGDDSAGSPVEHGVPEPGDTLAIGDDAAESTRSGH